VSWLVKTNNRKRHGYGQGVLRKESSIAKRSGPNEPRNDGQLRACQAEQGSCCAPAPGRDEASQLVRAHLPRPQIIAPKILIDLRESGRVIDGYDNRLDSDTVRKYTKPWLRLRRVRSSRAQPVDSLAETVPRGRERASGAFGRDVVCAWSAIRSETLVHRLSRW
jgi:hypothetical protein